MILHWWFPILKSTGYKFEFFFCWVSCHCTPHHVADKHVSTVWPHLFSLQFLQKATESVPSHSFPWVIRRKLTCSSASAAKSTVSNMQLRDCESVLMFTMKLNVLPFFGFLLICRGSRLSETLHLVASWFSNLSGMKKWKQQPQENHYDHIITWCEVYHHITWKVIIYHTSPNSHTMMYYHMALHGIIVVI